MTMPRRTFVKTTAAAIVGSAAMPAFAGLTGKPLRILFLGGTGFLGPHMVRDAIARGHTVTLFNRGKSNPHLFPGVEKLVGDRYADISALEGRDWDAVIDTFTYVPATVARTAEMLKDRVGQYIDISTISVYANYAKPGMDEGGPLAEMPDDVAAGIESHRQVGQYYGPMKARVEKTIESILPGRTCVIRPGLIVGPGDPTDRFTWWPVRVSRGGEVLSPGSPDHFTQSIDARDLASFVITCVERKNMGIYNADSPGATRTMGLLLETCRSVAGSDASFTWVPAAFLSEHGVGAWQQMTCWVPPEGDYAGFGQVSTKKAMANGLTIRPLSETVRDTLAWVNEEPEDEMLLERAINRRARLPKAERAGVAPEKEAEVLAAWHEKNG
jgi:nucleoside-diphosphate-sugar epimerase